MRAFPLVFLLFSTWVLSSVLSAQAQNIAYDLGPGAAYAVNSSRTVVGFALSNGTQYAFRYSSGTMIYIGTLPGRENSIGYNINNSGTIVGVSYGSTNYPHGFRYNGGTMTDIGTLGLHTYPYAINDSGIIVGESVTNGPYFPSHAFVLSNGKMTDLGTLGGLYSFALGINSGGTIVGSADVPSGAAHAFRYSGGIMTDLGTLDGQASYARAINDAGTIVGYASTNNYYHAVRYENGIMQDIGTLGGAYSEASAINSSGDIVGQADTLGQKTHAFLYRNGTMVDLFPYLATIGITGWSQALGINDNGDIVGAGFDASGNQHAFFIVAPPAQTSQSNYLRIKSFGFPELSATEPVAGPIEGSDGRLYGVTSSGYFPGFGAVYSLNKDGTGYTELHRFIDSTSGGREQPSRLWQARDGALYGTTTPYFGDSGDLGTVYKLNTNGTGFTLLHRFSGTAGDGSYPGAGVVEGKDGALYGTTQTGGSNDVGTIYKLNKDGSGYRVMRSLLSSGSGPRRPVGLIAGSDGVLYGTSLDGGTANLGTVFKISTDNSTFIRLRSFTGSGGDGTVPLGTLLEGSDGVLYGTTFRGGSNNLGTIFQLNKDGTGYRVLRGFPLGKVQDMRTGLVEGSDGALYGAAPQASFYYGTIFKINKDGTGYAELFEFDAGSTGEDPLGLLQGSDGALYGAANHGGLRGAGTVFNLRNDGSNFNVLWTFSPSGGDGQYPQTSVVGASDGNLYGTTSSGGSDDAGILFTCQNDGSGYAVLRSFTKSGGDGQVPRGAVIEGSDGILYGTTQKGGSNGVGTVFKVNKDGSGYGILRSFTFENGEAYNLVAGLLEGSDGALYGTAGGGAEGHGTVFTMQKDGSGYAVLWSFGGTGTNALDPLASLIEASGGDLYGTTFAGGNDGVGTIFKLHKDGSGYAVLHSFSRGSGDTPFSGLIEGTDGALYGTTSGGGSNEFGAPCGTVYKLNKAGSGFTVLHNFTGRNGDGCTPDSSVFETADGALYGTTAHGGSNDLGTVFTLNQDGSGYRILRSFVSTGGDGREPQANLVQASDGSLVGSTLQGGDLNFGTIFKVRLPPAILKPLLDQLVTVGSEVSLGVTVSGSQPLSFQWQFNGTNIAGATNAIYVIAAVQATDAGSYTVVVTNDLGTATSTAAILRVNNPPVADAGATSTLLLSPNGTNATVVLDGSRSFDLDGDLLQYYWFLGATKPLATGVVAIVTLPVGTNFVSLVVSDGMAASTNIIAIEVITSAQLVDRLVAAVQSDVSRSGPLLATLSAALASIDRSNPDAAINQLQAFQNQVRAQLEPLDSELAQTLIQRAQEIIDNLTSGSTGSPRALFTHCQRQGSGTFRLQFSTSSGKSPVIAASTNMTDWELIGVAVDRGDGTFEFEDAAAIRFGSRFYRFILP